MLATICEPLRSHRLASAPVCVNRVDVDIAVDVSGHTGHVAAVGGPQRRAGTSCAHVVGKAHQRIELLLCQDVLSHLAPHGRLGGGHPRCQLEENIGFGDRAS